MPNTTDQLAACPLCGDPHSAPSWLGATQFKGRRFDYVRCLSCHSLYCDPMPDAEVIGLMYGPSYEDQSGRRSDMDDPKVPGRVLEWLARRPVGTFVDYGCGAGELLTSAQAAGWHAVGVEYDAAVAHQTSARTGAEVLSHADASALREPLADVLHLGDVVEHLPEAYAELGHVLRLLRPGGILLAQGPLEANPNLFTMSLKAARLAKGRPDATFPPFHVMLATAAGQRACFARFPLEPLEFRVWEVAWPAPSKLTRANVRNPRLVVQWAARAVSRQTTRAAYGREWGNRYFYAGSMSGTAPSDYAR